MFGDHICGLHLEANPIYNPIMFPSSHELYIQDLRNNCFDNTSPLQDSDLHTSLLPNNKIQLPHNQNWHSFACFEGEMGQIHQREITERNHRTYTWLRDLCAENAHPQVEEIITNPHYVPSPPQVATVKGQG